MGVGLGVVGMIAAGALAVLSAPEPAERPRPTPLTATTETAAPPAPAAEPAPSSEAAAEPSDTPVAAPQSAEARPAPPPAICPPDQDRPQILVAFERSHPMNEAQRLFAEGRRDEARALAGRLLAERRDFRGLCLVRFTVGGAEMVVAAPSPDVVQDWTDRLNGMDGVAYAEPNLVASPY